VSLTPQRVLERAVHVVGSLVVVAVLLLVGLTLGKQVARSPRIQTPSTTVAGAPAGPGVGSTSTLSVPSSTTTTTPVAAPTIAVTTPVPAVPPATPPVGPRVRGRDGGGRHSVGH